MNRRIKKLFNNSIIFAIGNFGSRVISILMVPFYTYVLSTQEYGQVDLYLTAISLILPIATLSIPDAVLRFIMDEEEDNDTVVSNSLILMSIGFLLLVIFCVILSFFISFPKSLLLIIILQGIQLFASQYIRAIDLIKQYAYNGILMSVVLAISNVMFMKYFGLKVDGYLYSIILTNLVSILYLIRFIDFRGIIKKSNISKLTLIMILRYSLPLIPNGIMWWLLNASSRFFILNDLGVSYNGIFAVSNKIPSLLIVFQTIFFQAWQLSAIEESKSDDANEYSSRVYLVFSKFMFGVTLLLILFSKFIVLWFVSSEFSDAWKFIPFLLMGVLYSSFASFIGTQYLVLKRTSGMFLSSILGAVINVTFCYFLIPMIGLQGASVALFIGFLAVYLFRLYNIKKISQFVVSGKSEILNLIILLIASQIIFIGNTFILLIIFTVMILLFLVVNKEIISMLKAVIHVLKKKR